jgi:hypothetical protein
MSEYFKFLCEILKANKWNEPTAEQYHTYKAKGRAVKAPYFEDIHFAWRNYKPIINKL